MTEIKIILDDNSGRAFEARMNDISVGPCGGEHCVIAFHTKDREAFGHLMGNLIYAPAVLMSFPVEVNGIRQIAGFAMPLAHFDRIARTIRDRYAQPCDCRSCRRRKWRERWKGKVRTIFATAGKWWPWHKKATATAPECVER